MNNIYKEVAKDLGVNEDVVKDVFVTTWNFIKEKIGDLPLTEEISEDDFNKMKTAFVLPGLGMLGCNYKFYRKTRNKFLNEHKNDKDKRNKATEEYSDNDNGQV